MAASTWVGDTPKTTTEMPERVTQMFAAGCLWLCTAFAKAATATLPPPDPADLDPQVRHAVAEFERIVANRDLGAFERHIAPDAKMSFGGDEPGVAGLREVWSPQRPDTELWRELDRIVALGGVQSAENGKLVWSAPYPAFAGPDDLYEDPFSTFIVTGTRVALRSAPDEGADVLARVDYAVLNSDCDGTERWICVRWDGKPAYVHESVVRSPVDHRLSMEIAGGDWKIAYFVAGD